MIELRNFEMNDAAELAALANNPQIAENLRNGFPNPYGRADAEAFLSSCQSAENPLFVQAIVCQGKLAGCIGLTLLEDIYEDTAEIGYWLGASFWGKGLMTEAVRKMCVVGFENYGLFRIHAEPFAHNAASRRVLEKAGFQLEGILKKNARKNGKIIDSCIYAIWPENL